MISLRGLVSLFLITLLLSGCTTTPEKYKKNSANYGRPAVEALSASSSKMQAVATADIGAPQEYLDLESGMTAQLVVVSEYFSASGRTCRRFTQNVSGRSQSGVGCHDAQDGWVEVPLASVLR